MENILPYLIQAGELIGAAILGGWVSRILTIRSRVRQEQAGANKAEAEAKADEIQNIQDIVQKVYEPTILALKKQVEELREEVKKVRAENERLKDENDQLRDAIREISPDAIPSKRSENARRRARSANGQFVKKEDA